MKINTTPALVAAGIAGAGFGTTIGFLKKGEELEEQGGSLFKQVAGATVGGVTSGVVGAGIGVGTAGTVVALAKILGK